MARCSLKSSALGTLCVTLALLKRLPRAPQHGATGWSCFALTASAVKTIGTFDENIYPVYYEDQDYEWRLELAGNLWPCAVLGIVATRGAISVQSRRELGAISA